MAYRFVQGIDYGPRKGTLGLSFHMSEGFDGLPEFLSQHAGESRSQWIARVNGVSCHVAILSTGEIVQMLGWNRACGNLNPADRAGEYGYYGHQYLVDVLGSGWTDPNAWTVSCELAGFRANGPTQKQVQSAIRWGREMRAMFPTIRGAIGHHDQSPKPCPGKTPAMLAIFEGVGGHGLFGEDMIHYTAPIDEVGGTITTTVDTEAIPITGGTRPSLRAGVSRPALGVFTLDDLADRPCYLMLVGPQLCFVAASAVTFAPDDGPNPQTPAAEPVDYAVTVGGKAVGTVTLP